MTHPPVHKDTEYKAFTILLVRQEIILAHLFSLDYSKRVRLFVITLFIHCLLTHWVYIQLHVNSGNISDDEMFVLLCWML